MQRTQGTMHPNEKSHMMHLPTIIALEKSYSDMITGECTRFALQKNSMTFPATVVDQMGPVSCSAKIHVLPLLLCEVASFKVRE